MPGPFTWERGHRTCEWVCLYLFVRVHRLRQCKNWHTMIAVGTDGQANRHPKKRNNTSSYRPPIGHSHTHAQNVDRQADMNPCMTTNRCKLTHTLTDTCAQPTNQCGTYWHALTDELSKWFYKEIKRILIYAISLCPPSSLPPVSFTSLSLSTAFSPSWPEKKRARDWQKGKKAEKNIINALNFLTRDASKILLSFSIIP